MGTVSLPLRCAVVGAGRAGRAITAALPALAGPFGRGFTGTGYEAVLLCVPDQQIGAAAALLDAGLVVGHCSGAIGLDVLAPHEAFGVHPLMTIPVTGAVFAGAGAAVAGSTPQAMQFATELAVALGMHPFQITDADRSAYHAAASIASNFLVTLEDAAEQLARSAGADRAVLVPLVRAAVENWAAHGGPAALTGPIVRGDHATVARQRAAVVERAAHLVELFDALAAATQALADRTRPGSG